MMRNFLSERERRQTDRDRDNRLNYERAREMYLLLCSVRPLQLKRNWLVRNFVYSSVMYYYVRWTFNMHKPRSVSLVNWPMRGDLENGSLTRNINSTNIAYKLESGLPCVRQHYNNVMKIRHAKAPRNETKRRSFPGKQKDRAEQTADERGNKPTNKIMKNKQAREKEHNQSNPSQWNISTCLKHKRERVGGGGEGGGRETFNSF